MKRTAAGIDHLLIRHKPGNTSVRIAIKTLKVGFPLLMASLLFSTADCATVALSVRGNLLSVPTTKAVQSAAQLNATIATLPALHSLVGTAQCDVTVTQINYQTPGVRPGEMR